MLTNKTILITGGTGSFGNTFVPMTREIFNLYFNAISTTPVPYYAPCVHLKMSESINSSRVKNGKCGVLSDG